MSRQTKGQCQDKRKNKELESKRHVRHEKGRQQFSLLPIVMQKERAYKSKRPDDLKEDFDHFFSFFCDRSFSNERFSNK